MWYTVIINGKRHGFFKSQRGVKKGDPISLYLFIIASEVLTRMLNSLHQDPKYNGFLMHADRPKINRFAYADDVIIFLFRKVVYFTTY